MAVEILKIHTKIFFSWLLKQVAVKDFKIHAKENFKMATETCGCLEFQNSKWRLKHGAVGNFKFVPIRNSKWQLEHLTAENFKMAAET